VLRLPYDRNSLAISFRALDYTAPAKVQYRYRLDGVDHQWVEGRNRGEATYASVPPGRYTFRVTAAGQDGAWNPVGASIELYIAPPWWKSWWARVGAVAAAVLLVMLVVKIRVASMRRRSLLLEEQVEAQTKELTDAHERLRHALDREREAARELLDITAAVPGAVFQMRITGEGRRDFTFVSEGVIGLLDNAAPGQWPDGDDEQARHVRMAERLFLLGRAEERGAVDRSLRRSRETLLPWRAEWSWPGDGDREGGWLQVQAQPRRQPDGTIIWTGVISDATAARKAEAARAALEAKVLQAQQAESLAVLAGGIAHDFNNLLVGVQGNAELLAMELPPESDAAETVGHIRSAATRAADLTRQLLAYAGRGRFVVERVNLTHLVEEMLSLVRSAIPRSIAFDFRHGVEEQPIVEADATQLRQVVMNLVTNASEAIASDGGGVHVWVGTEHRDRAALQLLHAAPDMPAEGPYAVLRVTDDGVGMDEGTLSRIFDPFYTTKFTGRGLGLAALLGVVRAHHGGLDVVTAPGAGASFIIYLPLVDVAMQGHQSSFHEAGAGGIEQHLATRVLLVDDEPDVRDLTGRMLRRLGYQVAFAADGASTLMAVSDAEMVDVILMDVTMPNMDGPTAARELRQRGMDARIVLMSGYAETELVDRGVLADADAFLQKPFTQEELAAAIEGLVSSREPGMRDVSPRGAVTGVVS